MATVDQKLTNSGQALRTQALRDSVQSLSTTLFRVCVQKSARVGFTLAESSASRTPLRLRMQHPTGPASVRITALAAAALLARAPSINRTTRLMNWQWITTTPTALGMVLVSGVGIYIALLLLTRLTGLRSFSKMSSFDFATTVAFGSIIASTVLSKNPPLASAAFALAVLYALQFSVSRARYLSPRLQRLVDNEPLLLMAGETILKDHLRAARVTEDDLRSKLRMAGVTDRAQVLAVVFETTGDCSVLCKGDRLDPWLLVQVRGAERIPPDLIARHTPAR